MRPKKGWRMLAWIAAAACLVGSLSLGTLADPAFPEPAAPEQGGGEPLAGETIDGMKQAATAGSFSLLVAESGEYAGEFCLRDEASGLSWFSNPTDKTSDTTSKGSPRFEMFSQLIVYGYDTATNGEKTVNSYIGAQRGAGVTVTAVPHGFCALYRFESVQLEIPLYVTLSEDGLEIRSPLDELKENGTFRVVKLALAPYFGSGGPEDDGYLVVPDGSGARINFNNGKSWAEPYTALLYGENLSLASERKLTDPEPASLPVFGINRNQTGLLGVVGEGGAEAEITAYTAGQRNTRNTVYANFILRNVDTVVIGESGLSETKEVVQYDLDHRNMKACSVRYYPLESGKYTYADMAVRYRTILLEQRGETQAVDVGPYFVAELYGGIVRPKTYFGLTFQQFDTLTDYQKVSDIHRELQEAGIQGATILYRNWSKDESVYKLPNKIRPASGLGSKKKLQELLDDGLYLSFSPLTIRRNGNGFWSFLDASKRMSREPVLVYTYQLSTHYKNSEVAPGYLPNLQALTEALEAFCRSSEQYGAENLYLTDLGSTLYTNFDRKKYATREEFQERAVAFCKDWDGRLAVQKPNGYVLPYIDAAVGLPMDSSLFDVEDASIPFYQIALSGVIPYTSEAVNLSSNPRRTILKCIETASSLYFAWVGSNGTDIKETALNHLYGADYTRWKEEAIAAQKELDDVFERIGTRIIGGHETLADGVTRTTFENGKSIVINYTAQPVETSYGTVPASGYLVV